MIRQHVLSSPNLIYNCPKYCNKLRLAAILSRRPAHLSMLSKGLFYQYIARYSVELLDAFFTQSSSNTVIDCMQRSVLAKKFAVLEVRASESLIFSPVALTTKCAAGFGVSTTVKY